MKLLETIYLSLSVVFFFIGVHQTFTIGFAPSYFLYMFSIVFLFLFGKKRRKREEEEKIEDDKIKSLPKKK